MMKDYGFHKVPSYKTYLKNLNALIAIGNKKLVNVLDHQISHAPVKIIPTQSGWLSAALKNHIEKHVHDIVNPLEEALSQIVQIRNANKNLIMVGAGLGYHVGILCETSPSIGRIIVYERYPEFLKLMLSIKDYSREILKKRLLLFTWNTLHILKAKLTNDRNLYVWKHPILWNFYDEEYRLLTSLTNKSSTKCVVLLTGLMCRDICENFLTMGIEAYPLDIIHINPNAFQSFIKSYSPSFVISINYVKGVAPVCRGYGIPFVVWEIDPTIEILTPGISDTKHIIYYSYRKSRIPQLLNTGFTNVFFLPLATNHLRFKPLQLNEEEKERYGADISFVGSSMVKQGKWLKSLLLNSIDDPSITDNLLTAIDIQTNCLDRYILPYLIEKLCPSVKIPWIVQDKNGIFVDGTLCLAEECASKRRINLINNLDTLANNYVIKVWGDKDWQETLSDKIKYCGPAGHFYELPAIYKASRINLDINRLYQKDIVSLRVFDILATKSFVLADYSPDLHDLFDGEVVSYKSSKELKKLAEYYLQHPVERNEIAARGYEIIKRKHTIEHRLRRILSDLKTLSWL